MNGKRIGIAGGVFSCKTNLMQAFAVAKVMEYLQFNLWREFWKSPTPFVMCRNGIFPYRYVGYNDVILLASWVSINSKCVCSKEEVIVLNIDGKRCGISRPCGIAAWSA